MFFLPIFLKFVVTIFHFLGWRWRWSEDEIWLLFLLGCVFWISVAVGHTYCEMTKKALTWFLHWPLIIEANLSYILFTSACLWSGFVPHFTASIFFYFLFFTMEIRDLPTMPSLCYEPFTLKNIVKYTSFL